MKTILTVGNFTFEYQEADQVWVSINAGITVVLEQVKHAIKEDWKATLLTHHVMGSNPSQALINLCELLRRKQVNINQNLTILEEALYLK